MLSAGGHLHGRGSANGATQCLGLRHRPALRHLLERLHGRFIEGVGRLHGRSGHTSWYGRPFERMSISQGTARATAGSPGGPQTPAAEFGLEASTSRAVGLSLVFSDPRYPTPVTGAGSSLPPALTWTPSPGVESAAPRARGATASLNPGRAGVGPLRSLSARRPTGSARGAEPEWCGPEQCRDEQRPGAGAAAAADHLTAVVVGV